jgi:hypothetical protein
MLPLTGYYVCTPQRGGNESYARPEILCVVKGTHREGEGETAR